MITSNFNQKSLKTCAALLALFNLQACGDLSQSESSDLSVTNGIEITANEYPAVVELTMFRGFFSSGRCTGTFVSDSLLITAAHCVYGLDKTPGQVQTRVEGEDSKLMIVRALSVVVHPDYRHDGSILPTDIAVVTFPEKTSKHYVSIHSEVPHAGDGFTIVGYGNNRTYLDYNGRLAGDGSGVKRVGSNVVHDVGDGFITFLGVLASAEDLEPGTGVLAGSGDSGGPLFIDGALTAVTSGGGLYWAGGGHVGVAYYVDINSESSQRFLSEHLVGLNQD